MKKIEYLTYKKVSEDTLWDYKLVGKGKKPIPFIDIPSLKDDRVMAILFFKIEREFDDKDPSVQINYKEKLVKKYIIGTECNFNDLPTGTFYGGIEILDKEEFESKNPLCALTRDKKAILLEECGGALIDDCEVEIIDSNNLNNIIEINFDKIETKSLKI